MKETKLYLRMKGGLKPTERKEEWEQELDQFNEFLKQMRLVIHDVEGDGNCLFYALGDQNRLLNEENHDHNYFIEVSVHQLKSNKELY